MNNLAHKLQPRPELDYGHVLAENDDGYLVLVGETSATAWPSASCLLRPCVGDEVLLSMDASGRCFILSVLVRADESAENKLDFQGPVTMHVAQGSLHVLAEENVTLSAGEQYGCMARKVSVLADEAEMRVERTSFLGKVLQANVQATQFVANTLETTARRLTQRLRDIFCYVEDQSEFQAKNARHLVEETLTMQAKNAFHTADEIIKVDGEQVHLG